MLCLLLISKLFQRGFSFSLYLYFSLFSVVGSRTPEGDAEKSAQPDSKEISDDSGRNN